MAARTTGTAARRLHIAIIEASHWHVPLYLDALSGPGLEVVAVSDREGRAGAAVAERFGARLYRDEADLLAAGAIDFAFVFGRHARMATIARRLIEANVAFSIEKPCGLTLAEVAGIEAQARARGLFAAVPFILRRSPLKEAIEGIGGGLPLDVRHISMRFMVGPPQRYLTNGCGWMLDPAEAGGGVLINIGVHLLDMFRWVSGEEVAAVSAVTSNAAHGLPVEDYAAVMLRGRSSALGIAECAYTFPSGPDEAREVALMLRSRDKYVRFAGAEMNVRAAGGDTGRAATRPVHLDTDGLYRVYAERTLDDFRMGRPPVSGLGDAMAVMAMVDAAYRSSAAGGTRMDLA